MTITPQNVGAGLPISTYYPVNSPEYIALESIVFCHLYNSSTTDDIITVVATQPDSYGVYNCFLAFLDAGEELILGPFDLSVFGSILELTHSHITDVTMAVLTPYNIYETGGFTAVTMTYPDSNTITVAYPTTQIAETVSYPSVFTASTVAYPATETAKTEAYPDSTVATEAYPDTSISTELWNDTSTETAGYPTLITESTVKYPSTEKWVVTTYPDSISLIVAYPDSTIATITYPDSISSTEIWGDL